MDAANINENREEELNIGVHLGQGFQRLMLDPIFRTDALSENLLIDSLFPLTYQHPQIDLSPNTLRSRSATIWTISRLLQSGQPMTRPRLILGTVLELFSCFEPIDRHVPLFNTDDNITRASQIIRTNMAFWYDAVRCPDDMFNRYFEGNRDTFPAELNEDSTVAQIRQYFYTISRILTLPHRLIVASLLSTAVISYAKRGQASEALIQRISEDMSAITHLNIEISPDVVFQFYKICGTYLNSENAQRLSAILYRRLNHYPDGLRLALTIQRMSGSGLTVYLMIGQALTAFTDFPWARIMRIAPSDFTNYNIALGTIGNNMFYGYGTGANRISSTTFKTLGYASARLLEICFGQRSIRAYAGFGQGVRQKNEINRIVDEYSERRLLVPDGQDADRYMSVEQREIMDQIQRSIALPNLVGMFAVQN